MTFFYFPWVNLSVMEGLHDVILIELEFNPIYLWSMKKAPIWPHPTLQMNSLSMH